MDVDVPELPAEYETYRDEVRAFIAQHAPAVERTRRAGLRTPDTQEEVDALRRWVQALHDAGHTVGRWADEGTDPHRVRVLEQELRAAGLQSVLGNPLVGSAISTFGTDEQQGRFLPAMARGDHIWTQLFSEPNAGSDLASLQTRARRDGDSYVIDGQKVWCTWAQWADYGYLLARTEEVPGSRGITALILDMHSPGVETRPLREMTGTADFNEVFLDNVRVPVENIIGEAGDGWRIANLSLAQERGGVGGGDGDDPVRRLVALARSRRFNGRPAIDDSAVRQAIARIAARARIRRFLGYRIATVAGRGAIEPWHAPMAKIWFSELNLEITEFALSLEGPRSMLVEPDPLAAEDGRWQDAFLYARAWTIAGGSNEILRNVIAERGLGLPREERRR